MARKNKHSEISNILRQRITSGLYKSGDDFPTNIELKEEFESSLNTIHQAVYPLIQEGLVVTYGSGNNKRKVRDIVLGRSERSMGFIREYKGRSKQTIISLSIFTPNTINQAPEKVIGLIEAPFLRYKTLQLRDGVPVAISDSYIPNIVSLIDLMDHLGDSNNELYDTLTSMGISLSTCEESLVVDWSTDNECELFGLPPGNNLQVVRIKRKVYDKNNNLIELCYLVDRADAYEFTYKFKL